MSESFFTLVQEWKDWSAAADQSENGWQSDFYNWKPLMEMAVAAMTDPFSHSVQTEKNIEFCWNISEETEDLADYASDHIKECMPILRTLCLSSYPTVRWQVYSVLSKAGEEGEELLRRGLNDPDPYCRRRALSSLALLHPKDAKEIANRFKNDNDPYIRQAAHGLEKD
jgi:hypothetical protein